MRRLSAAVVATAPVVVLVVTAAGASAGSAVRDDPGSAARPACVEPAAVPPVPPPCIPAAMEYATGKDAAGSGLADMATVPPHMSRPDDPARTRPGPAGARPAASSLADGHAARAPPSREKS